MIASDGTPLPEPLEKHEGSQSVSLRKDLASTSFWLSPHGYESIGCVLDGIKDSRIFLVFSLL